MIKDGVKYDFIETEFFKLFDDKISKLFSLINSSSPENRFSVSENEMPLLQCFVNIMYWRLPHRGREIEEMMNEDLLKAFAYRLLFESKRQNIDIKEIEKRISKDANFKKYWPSAMAIADTIKMTNCRTPLTIQPFIGGFPHVCSDNPVLFDNIVNPKVHKDDFIFPIREICYSYVQHEQRYFPLFF